MDINNLEINSMKKFSNESIFKGLRYAIDFALILQLIGLIYLIIHIVTLSLINPADDVTINDTTIASMSSPPNNIMISFSNPELGKYLPTIKKTFFLFSSVCWLINLIALLLITFQLKYIFKSFSLEDYFNPSNALRIKKIAAVIFIWVLVDYVIRFIPDMIIPHYTIHCMLGVNTFRAGILVGLEGFNLKMLVLSIIVFMLSVVFSYGYSLKEESSLTI